MNIQFNEHRLLIDTVEVSPYDLQSLICLLGKSFRKFNLESGITLYVYDSIGLRFWAENQKITEVQVEINLVSTSNYFPSYSFKGTLNVLGKIVINNDSLFTSDVIELLNLKIDTDSIRYGLYMYEMNFTSIKLTIKVFNSDKIEHVSYRWVG